MEGGRSGETPEGTRWVVSSSPDHQAHPWEPLSQELSPSLSGLKAATPVTCCLVLETHVSSSRSRRERWKARVVLTAMKMSPSCSSRGPGFGWFSLSGLEGYRRDRSPTHRRVKRAPARPRKTRQCIGSEGAPQTVQPPTPQSVWGGRLVRRGPWYRQESGRHRGQAPTGTEEAGSLDPEAEPPPSCQPARHQPATCSSALPRGRAAQLLAPPLPQPEGRG